MGPRFDERRLPRDRQELDTPAGFFVEVAPSGSLPDGVCSLTGTSTMRDAIYLPTAAEIRTACASIRAERLALMQERPTTTKAVRHVQRSRVPSDVGDR